MTSIMDKKDSLRVKHLLGKSGWTLQGKGNTLSHLESLEREYGIDVSEFSVISPDDLRQGDKLYRILLGENGGISYIVTRGTQEDYDKAEQWKRDNEITCDICGHKGHLRIDITEDRTVSDVPQYFCKDDDACFDRFRKLRNREL